jgi:glycosyltransferase involved in cell wall biosynthesis
MLADSAGIGEVTYFPGAVTYPDVAFSALDAIAIPSRFEGLPLVALEALSSRLPGVASRVDGLAAVWPADWLIEVGDSDGLAEKLTEILYLDPRQAEAVLLRAQARVDSLLTDDLRPVVRDVIGRVAAQRC